MTGTWSTWTTAARADGEAMPPVTEPPPPPKVEEPATPRVNLRHDLGLDMTVTFGIAAGAGVWSLVRSSVVPERCGLCDGGPGHVDAIDQFFRDALKRPDTGPATTLSDVFGYGLAPLSALGLGAAAAIADRRGDEALLDVLLVAEATAVDIAVDEVTVALVRRERPDFHFIVDPDARSAAQSANAFSSFPSGHTSAAFAMAASAGTVASMRGYRLAPLVWIAGMTIGVTTGYLRMAADRHYFTDVLSGAVIGTSIGIAVPYFFHRPETASASAATRLLQTTSIATNPVPGGRVVSLGWSF